MSPEVYKKSYANLGSSIDVGIPGSRDVANGTYQEAVTLSVELRLEGGWAPAEAGWTPDCSVDATKIVVTDSDVAVSAKDLNGATALAFVSVENSTPAKPSGSLYGIFARGATTKLTLEDVRVFVADAGNGNNGAAGDYGLPGGVVGSAGCPAGDGAPGKPAIFDWTYPVPGGFSSGGYEPRHGALGSDGSPGHNGTASTLAATCVRKCSKVASSTSCVSVPDSCGTAGNAGCGGGGGKAGGAGLGGGSSIALYVWDATVSVLGGSLRAGNGGRGGMGGPGGRGGDGGFGVVGSVAANACTQCVGQSTVAGLFYTGTTEIGRGAAGGPGGMGGPGTDGSNGTDGAGGFSYSLYRNAAKLVALDGSELIHGEPGGTYEGADPGDANGIGGPSDS